MKLNNLTKLVAMLGRWMATMLFCVAAIAGVWQGAFFSNSEALAAPQLMAANVGNQVEKAADDVRAGSKDLIQDVKNKVEKTASKNAAKVDQADDEGTFAERKAKRDKARIFDKAEKDASRTETAVDKSMDAVKNAVNKAEDAFGN